MTFEEGFLLVIRWLHILSAVAWVGGSLFFLLVLRPTLARGTPPSPGFLRSVGEGFGSLVEVCIAVLLITGTVLAISRITAGYATAAYGVILGLHISLAVWVFWLAWLRRRAAARRGWRRAINLADDPPLGGRVGRALTSSTTIAVVGVVIILLSDVMRLLVERSLAAP